MGYQYKAVVLILLISAGATAKAQSYELQVLLLDMQKLTEFKNILSDMEQGYDLLTQGYETVKDITEGNFSLHKVFLDNLLQVSPIVQEYQKVGEIIRDQLTLVTEYGSAYKRFEADATFSSSELKYFSSVYTALVDASLQKLDDLTMVLTAGVLRMSDDERMAYIDRLAEDMKDKLSFLHYFNNSASLLSIQRKKDKENVGGVKDVYGLH